MCFGEKERGLSVYLFFAKEKRGQGNGGKVGGYPYVKYRLSSSSTCVCVFLAQRDQLFR